MKKRNTKARKQGQAESLPFFYFCVFAENKISAFRMNHFPFNLIRYKNVAPKSSFFPPSEYLAHPIDLF
jgi:hypothetical protein